MWTPGSYLIREFERHLQDFEATDAGGQALSWVKLNKNSWRIITNGAREWRARYSVYCNELSVRTSEVNSDHAFWNNATLLMYPEGLLNAPSTLQILAPQSWKVATGLPAVPGVKNTFRAESFDILYDSPVEVSNFKRFCLRLSAASHRDRCSGNYDLKDARGRRKIVETEIELMGGEILYAITHLFFTAIEYGWTRTFELNCAAIALWHRPEPKRGAVTSVGPNAPAARTYRGFLSPAHATFERGANSSRRTGPDYTKKLPNRCGLPKVSILLRSGFCAGRFRQGFLKRTLRPFARRKCQVVW